MKTHIALCILLATLASLSAKEASGNNKPSPTAITAAKSNKADAKMESSKTMLSASKNKEMTADEAESLLEGKGQSNQSDNAGGIYQLEDKYTFNVLDSVYYDAGNDQLSLIGHFDKRFSGKRIPYLQHLATLLESPKPQFSLTWTPDSEKRINGLFARHLSQSESDSITDKWGELYDKEGNLTKAGKCLLPALGVSPIFGNHLPGSMGVDVVRVPNTLYVKIVKVAPNSPAAAAGLKVGDTIKSINATPPFSPEEFDHFIRLRGEGGSVPTEVIHSASGQRDFSVIALGASEDHDVWRSATDQFSVIRALYFAAGNNKAGQCIDMLGTINRVNAKYRVPDEISGNMQAGLYYMLGLWDDVLAARKAGKSQAVIMDFTAKFCRALDDTFGFEGSPISNAFAHARKAGGDADAMGAAVSAELRHELVPRLQVLLDPIFQRPEGLQIPPELVEDQFHVHPEMVPQYLGVDSHSLLARVMFSSDYLCKRLMERPDLKQSIPSYQTGFEFEVKHPEFRHQTGNYRIWISVDKMDARQSVDKKGLAFSDVRMRFNIRDESGNASDGSGKDLPNKPGGYEDLLTSLWDNFEQEYFTLHELRESAKLAVAAKWILSQNAAAKLPKVGRVSWQGPAKIPGLVFFEITPDSSRATKTKVIIIANGGVSLRSDSSVVTDSSVVDLRESPRLAVVLGTPNDTLVRAGSGGPTQRNGYAAGWVSTINWDGKDEQAVVLVTKLPSAKSTDIAGAENGELHDAVADKIAPAPSSDLDRQENDLLVKLAQARAGEEKAALDVQLSHIRAAKGDVKGASEAWTQALKENADGTYKAEHDFQAAKAAADKAALFPGRPPSTQNPGGGAILPFEQQPHVSQETLKGSAEAEWVEAQKFYDWKPDPNLLRHPPPEQHLPTPQLFKLPAKPEERKQLDNYIESKSDLKKQLVDNVKAWEKSDKEYQEKLKTDPGAAAQIKDEMETHNKEFKEDLKKKLKDDPEFQKLNVPFD